MSDYITIFGKEIPWESFRSFLQLFSVVAGIMVSIFLTLLILSRKIGAPRGYPGCWRLEIKKPSKVSLLGFIIAWIFVGLIILLTVWLAKIGT